MATSIGGREPFWLPAFCFSVLINSLCLAGRQFNVHGELTQKKQSTRTTAVPVGDSADAAADEAKSRRRSSSVAEHVRQITAASTEALQRPRKERDRFRRFIVDVVTQGECIPGGRKKVPPVAEVAAEATDAVIPDVVASVPDSSSAPLTTGEKDLLR